MAPDNQKRRSSSLSKVQMGAVLAATERLTECKGSGTTVIVAEVVADLIDALGSGDNKRIEQALIHLGAGKDSDLYHGVGNMARNLHDSLREFQVSLSRESVTMDTTSLPDAADKLEAVVRMTFEAAEKTMSLADQQLDLLREISDERKRLRSHLDRSDISVQELKHQVLQYLERADTRGVSLGRIASEVVMAQSYQDLTGQALRKVVKLVTNIEKQLLDLIALFGLGKDTKTSDVPAAVDTKGPGALDQDKADDLLKSLGF